MLTIGYRLRALRGVCLMSDDVRDRLVGANQAALVVACDGRSERPTYCHRRRSHCSRRIYRREKFYQNSCSQAPFAVMVPDTLKEVEFIEEDSKRFSKTRGWAYAPFLYNAGSDAYTPLGSGAECGYSCYTIVAKKDYIFTAYAKR